MCDHHHHLPRNGEEEPQIMRSMSGFKPQDTIVAVGVTPFLRPQFQQQSRDPLPTCYYEGAGAKPGTDDSGDDFDGAVAQSLRRAQVIMHHGSLAARGPSSESAQAQGQLCGCNSCRSAQHPGLVFYHSSRVYVYYAFRLPLPPPPPRIIIFIAIPLPLPPAHLPLLAFLLQRPSEKATERCDGIPFITRTFSHVYCPTHAIYR